MTAFKKAALTAVSSFHSTAGNLMLALLAFALFALPQAANSASAVWNGSADTTWYTKDTTKTNFTISTAEQLAGLALLVNGSENKGAYNMSGKTITLANDILLNDTTGWQSWDSTTTGLNSWVAIGIEKKPFKGAFNGNGYVVSGMYINSSSNYQGLFGYSSTAVVKNVGVVNFYVKGNGYVSGLAGYYSGGAISNSYVNGLVIGNGGVGVLVGLSSDATISNSYGISGGSGKLIGKNNGTIYHDYYHDNNLSKPAEEMQTQRFVEKLNISSDVLGTNAWVYSEGKYPTLSNSPVQSKGIAAYFENGTGTEGNPYIIETKEQLENFSIITNTGHSFSGEYITLANNIQLNDTTGWQTWDNATTGLNRWEAIGSKEKPFKGAFNGNSYVVRGMYRIGGNNFGLFGYDSAAVIKNVGVVNFYIFGTNGGLGGLVGYNNKGTIINSYAIGIGKSNSIVSVGGLVGESLGGMISNSYANVNVQGSFSVGALVGKASSLVTNCYASGTVISEVWADDERIGGLIGDANGVIHNSYYDSEISGLNYEGKGIPQTTAEMQSQRLVDLLNTGSEVMGANAWIYNEGKYPTLSNSPIQSKGIAAYFENGTGTEDNPYIIKTKKQLEDFAIVTNAGHSFSGEYITLANDIQLNDTTGWQNWNDSTPGLTRWFAIGSKYNHFRGTFNGDSYVISGMYEKSSINYSGLFGYDSVAVIKNIGVVGFRIRNHSYAGGLVGYNNRGTVVNSYAVGIVSGAVSGGLVGNNSSYGKVMNSYTNCNVSGSSHAGGLIGANDNSGMVTNNYASGTVSGSGRVGGLSGSNSGTITYGYYDSETSKLSTDWGSNAISQTTTAQMKSISFVNTLNNNAYTLNRKENTEPKLFAWSHENGEYPKLTKEIVNAPVVSKFYKNNENFYLQVHNRTLKISLPATSKDAILELYNLNGTKVHSLSLASATYEVSLANLSKGLYLAKVSFGSESKIVKFAVK